MTQLERLCTHWHDHSDSGGADGESDEPFFHSRRHLNMRIRLLQDSILASQISNEVKLETMHRGFLATIDRRKELLEQIQQLNKQCQLLHEKNQNLREMSDERARATVQLESSYRERIDEQRAKQIDWEEKIQSLPGQS